MKVERCAACPARQYPACPPEFASGKTHLAIVGESPGPQELEAKRPFIGASGRKMMNGLSRELGLDRSQVHWTNATLCRPPERMIQQCVRACATRLRAELRAAAPIIVMPVGAWGVSGVLFEGRKRIRIQKWRGSITQFDLSQDTRGSDLGGPKAAKRLGSRVRALSANTAGATPALATGQAVGEGIVGTIAPTAVPTLVMPTIHPAAIGKGRSPLLAPLLELDVERAAKYLQGQPFVPLEDAAGHELVIADREDLLAHELTLLGDAVGNDVETVGLGPTRTALVCLALSDGARTVVIPWSQARDGRECYWLAPKRVAKLITECLASRLSVTHNGPFFDFIVEERYGIHVQRWEDTLLQAHALRSHEPRNLYHVVSRGLDVGAWKEQEDRNADLPRLYRYNARDSLYTVLRWTQQRDEMRAA